MPREKRRRLRAQAGSVRPHTVVASECYQRIEAIAAHHGITVSSAINELLRTHPLVGLPSLLRPDDG